jgi:hypothetical protein
MNQFQYTALPSENHIRIIELLPGAPEDVIRCNLSVELRHAQNPYDALSYVWGGGKDDEIICGQGSMRVTTNLANGLRAIRAKNPNRSIRLWADAISINQYDTIEKNHQVRKMGSIYENATQVHIWLGLDENGIAQDLFNLIQKWIQLLEEYREPSRVPHTVAKSDLCTDLNRGMYLAKLMDRPWFSRVWVVQEVALSESAQLYWGNATLNFADLVELACFYNGSSNVIGLIGGDIAALGFLRLLFRCVYRTYGKTGSWGTHKSYYFKRLTQQHPLHSALFLDILLIGKSLSASEVNDHVYSFLGNPLALDGEGKTIVEPDYRKPEDKVNLELADALLRSPESPYVLCFVQHCSVEEITGSRGPSWVPRWRNDTTDRKPTFTIGNIGLGHTAGGGAGELQYHIQDNRALVLQGLIFDQLCWTSAILKSENFSLDSGRWDDGLRVTQNSYVEMLWGEVSLAFERLLGSTKTLNLDRYEDDFSYTLVSGYNNPRVISKKRHQGIFKAYRRVLERKRNIQPVTSKYIVSKTQDEEASRFEMQTRNCSKRRLGVTNSGGFALVPEFAQAGDKFALFLGMATPFVLRPANVQFHGEGYYHVVGEAYVHGTMRGELAGDLEKDMIEIMLV